MYGFRFFSPWVIGDPENWIPSNPIVSPIHIQPEWYFLFAYEILRSIPNKLGGVVFLALRVLVLYFLRLSSMYRIQNIFNNKIALGCFFHSFIILTWLGSCRVIEPFIFLGKCYSVLYFLSLIILLLS